MFYTRIVPHMSVLDFVFPKKCLNCGREGKYLCENCLDKVPKLKTVCPYCEKASIDGMTHAKCVRVYGLDGLISVWDWEGVIRKAILALKYRYATEIASELSSCLVAELKDHYSYFVIHNSSVLTPIPLHWYRDNFRGFNQSELIGKEIAKSLDWKFAPDLLIRKKFTTPQSTLKRQDRFPNIRGAFALFSRNSLFVIPNSIVLFDDVFTTGSTLKEAASVLKRAGVKSVWGLTIVR